MAGGKRAGARPKRRFRPVLLVLALGVTGSVVAWGYLVLAAIDFGTTARTGDSVAWAYLALASAGAVACLFLALILVARISRQLGITRPPPPRDGGTGSPPPTRDGDRPPPSPGRRRAAR